MKPKKISLEKDRELLLFGANGFKPVFNLFEPETCGGEHSGPGPIRLLTRLPQPHPEISDNVLTRYHTATADRCCGSSPPYFGGRGRSRPNNGRDL